MHKRRRLDRQNIPQNAEEVIALLRNCCDEYTIYLAFIINESISGEFRVRFISRKWYNTLQYDSETLIFYQLMNIFLQFKSYTLPALHILMSRKSCSLYERIVNKIKEILPFRAWGSYFLWRGIVSSLSVGYPDADASSCLFHHKKATY